MSQLLQWAQILGVGRRFYSNERQLNRTNPSQSGVVLTAMTLTRDQLFADLDALTAEQIEAGLAAGVWGDDARPTVEHYVLKRKFAADQRNAVVTAQQVAKVAMEQAASAKLWATAAFIIAAGAMVAAMVSGFVAFLALRHWTTLW